MASGCTSWSCEATRPFSVVRNALAAGAATLAAGAATLASATTLGLAPTSFASATTLAKPFFTIIFSISRTVMSI